MHEHPLEAVAINPYVGKVLSAIVADATQIAQWGL